jgi:hypothetical protein
MTTAYLVLATAIFAILLALVLATAIFAILLALVLGRREPECHSIARAAGVRAQLARHVRQLVPPRCAGLVGGVRRIDLVNVSGREDMSVSDRIALLRTDLMNDPFRGITEATVANSQTIHDIKLTVGHIRSTLEMCDRAYARGETDETLSKGAHLMLSPVECVVLAWRRGGHREYQRVIAALREMQP